MTIAAVLFVLAVLAVVLAALPYRAGHHCCIGWGEPTPGYVVPSSLNAHWLWRQHRGCDSEACEWKRTALAALWTRGRLRPDARIEKHLRGQK